MLLPTPEERLTFLKDRQKGLGGSDMAAIAGLDPFNDPMDIYLSKVREVDPDEEMNIHMFRGIVLEPLAAQLYAERTGRDVVAVGVKEHPNQPWARVNIDREIRADGVPPGVLEIKAPGKNEYQRVIEFGAREQHIVQLQHGMYVTGCSWGSFAEVTVEHPSGPIIYFDQEPNPLLIEQLEERGEDFWLNFVLERKPPTLSEWGRKAIEVPAFDAERHVVDTPDIRVPLSTLLTLGGLRKEVEQEYLAARRVVEAWLDKQQYTKIEVPGQGKVNYGWRDGRTSFDHERLAEYGALDPDRVADSITKLAHALRTEIEKHPDAAGPVAEWAPVLEQEILRGIPRLLKDSELDLDLFTTVSDAYRHFQPYPAKDRADESEEA